MNLGQNPPKQYRPGQSPPPKPPTKPPHPGLRGRGWPPWTKPPRITPPLPSQGKT